MLAKICKGFFFLFHFFYMYNVDVKLKIKLSVKALILSFVKKNYNLII